MSTTDKIQMFVEKYSFENFDGDYESIQDIIFTFTISHYDDLTYYLKTALNNNNIDLDSFTSSLKKIQDNFNEDISIFKEFISSFNNKILNDKFNTNINQTIIDFSNHITDNINKKKHTINV